MKSITFCPVDGAKALLLGTGTELVLTNADDRNVPLEKALMHQPDFNVICEIFKQQLHF